LPFTIYSINFSESCHTTPLHTTARGMQ
jgi:hypothetical protein